MLPTVLAFVTRVLLDFLSLSPNTASGVTPSQIGSHPSRISAPTYRVQIYVSSPRLLLYQNNILIRSYPVALGKIDTQTPIGEWHIIDKQKDWGGGFGTRWLGLDVPWGTYGIHGTNRPESITHYVSSGCIRLTNENVEELYETVPIGTPVNIVGDPLRHLRMLQHGDIGADVQVVQKSLQKAGYFPGECDGRFDSGLQFSVMMFQLSRKIPMNGMVDMNVFRELGLVGDGRK